jgi:hypothetical protein
MKNPQICNALLTSFLPMQNKNKKNITFLGIDRDGGNDESHFNIEVAFC